jgi:hypothetical protein
MPCPACVLACKHIAQRQTKGPLRRLQRDGPEWQEIAAWTPPIPQQLLGSNWSIGVITSDVAMLQGLGRSACIYRWMMFPLLILYRSLLAVEAVLVPGRLTLADRIVIAPLMPRPIVITPTSTAQPRLDGTTKEPGVPRGASIVCGLRESGMVSSRGTETALCSMNAYCLCARRMVEYIVLLLLTTMFKVQIGRLGGAGR